jgi:hypothetical protein
VLFYYSAPLLATSSPFASNPGRPMLCRCGRWHDLSSCHGLMAVQQGFVCNSYKYGSALVRSETPPCSGQPNTNQQICLEGMCCRLPQRANQTMFPSSSHISGRNRNVGRNSRLTPTFTQAFTLLAEQQTAPSAATGVGRKCVLWRLSSLVAVPQIPSLPTFLPFANGACSRGRPAPHHFAADSAEHIPVLLPVTYVVVVLKQQRQQRLPSSKSPSPLNITSGPSNRRFHRP